MSCFQAEFKHTFNITSNDERGQYIYINDALICALYISKRFHLYAAEAGIGDLYVCVT
jgi:hypothetical protein